MRHTPTSVVGITSLALGALTTGALGQAPDVVLSDINGTTHYGPVGGVHAYAIGSDTCNVGDANLGWGSQWDGSPQLSMNMYRLSDGRLEQIGMGWCKTGCCAFAASGCGLPCNGQGGSVLGAGCLDVYGAGFNGGQFGLGPRSNINPFTGEMLDATGGQGLSAIDRRLQVKEAEMFAGARYFVEGFYIAVDEAPNGGNVDNNASYREVNIDASFNLSLAGATTVGLPAIYAWQDNVPGVVVQAVDVPSEGRYYVGVNATDLGNGQFRYDYAIFNQDSDRAAASISIPVPDSVTLSNVKFGDVDYHSGDPYDGSSWVFEHTNGFATWSCPETEAANPNANALRWGTMYTFSFEANSSAQRVDIDLGLFKSGAPSDVVWPNAVAPRAAACPCDTNGDGNVEVGDLLGFLADFFANGDPITSLLEYLSCYFPASSGAGCP